MVKRIIFSAFLVVLTVVIYNCNDAGVVENGEGFEISGTVNGWTQPSRIVKALVYGSPPTTVFLADSTRIQSDGSFTVKLKDPTDNVKYTFVVPSDSTCTNNVVISPPGFRYTKVELKVYNDSNIYVGRIIRAFSYPPPVAGSFYVDYYHFGESVSVNGVNTCIGGSDTNIARYNYSGVKGWNKAVNRYNVYSGSKVDKELTSTEPVGAAWMFTP